jgi:hypothetical protein
MQNFDNSVQHPINSPLLTGNLMPTDFLASAAATQNNLFKFYLASNCGSIACQADISVAGASSQ